MALPLIRTDIIPFTGYQRPYRFDLMERQELSRTADGVTRPKAMGPPIWMAEYRSIELSLARMMQFEAMLRSLDGAVRLFEAYDIRRPFPLLRDGYAGGGTIQAVGADNRSLRITGLPAGMALSVGDYLAYDLNGIRRLHQVMEPATASSGGLTPLFELRPHLPPGIATGISVNFARPSARMALEPGSVMPELTGAVTGVVSFRAFQAP